MNGEYAAGYEEGFQAGKNWGLSLNNDDLETLRQENAALREKLDLHTKLQPMDTAPKDGTRVMLVDEKGCKHIAYCDDDNIKDENKKHGRWIVFDMDEYDSYYSVELYEYELKGWLPLPEGTEGL